MNEDNYFIFNEEGLIELLKKRGYEMYKLKDGSVWMSKGCPHCSKEKVKIK